MRPPSRLPGRTDQVHRRLRFLEFCLKFFPQQTRPRQRAWKYFYHQQRHGLACNHHPVVSLSWIASTSMVAGYSIYRSTTSGNAYVKTNPSLVSGFAYTGSKATSRATYCYVTTAVASDNESAFSNQATAVIAWVARLLAHF